MISTVQLEKLVRNLSLTWADVINDENFTLESIHFSPSSLARVVTDDAVALVFLLMGQGTESGQVFIHPAVPGCLRSSGNVHIET